MASDGIGLPKMIETANGRWWNVFNPSMKRTPKRGLVRDELVRHHLTPKPPDDEPLVLDNPDGPGTIRELTHREQGLFTYYMGKIVLGAMRENLPRGHKDRFDYGLQQAVDSRDYRDRTPEEQKTLLKEIIADRRAEARQTWTNWLSLGEENAKPLIDDVEKELEKELKELRAKVRGE